VPSQERFWTYVLTVVWLAVFSSSLAAAGAFPGAEGFGAQAKGGAGGKVIWVTNLNAAGPGSLREAVNTEGPRIIRFRVAGTIELGREWLVIGGPRSEPWKDVYRDPRLYEKLARTDGPWPESRYWFVTIDGSSAPPPGITISGSVAIQYGASHVVLRHLRIRDNGCISRSSADGITITDGCKHVMIDHCSLTGARDEALNPWGLCSDITFQWCLVQGYGSHACAFINGGGSDRIALNHCLSAHSGRAWHLLGNARGQWTGKFPNEHPILDVRNTVVYNSYPWIGSQIQSGAYVNFVGNTYIPGPSSSLKYPAFHWHEDCQGHACDNDIGPLPLKRRDGKPSGPWLDKPFPAPPVTTHAAKEARELVLAQAGAWPRDAIDAGVVRTVLEGSGYLGLDNRSPQDFSNARPAVSVSASGKSTEVTFTAQASDADGQIVSCTWDFGDGKQAVGKEVKHVYSAPGEYVATALAMDNLGMTGAAQVKVQVRNDRPAEVQQVPFEPVPGLAQPDRRGAKPPQIVSVPRMPAGGAREGFPTDEAWLQASPLQPFIIQSNWHRAKPDDVDARVLHDGKHLYLRVVCELPKGGVKPIRRPASAGEEMWRMTCQEVYLAPQWGREPWFQFVFNDDGIMADSKGFERRWNCTPECRTRSRAEGSRWVFEMVLALEGIELPQVETGARLGLKLHCCVNKDKIFLWPPLAPADGAPPNLHPVIYSPEPTGYAQLVLE